MWEQRHFIKIIQDILIEKEASTCCWRWQMNEQGKNITAGPSFEIVHLCTSPSSWGRTLKQMTAGKAEEKGWSCLQRQQLSFLRITWQKWKKRERKKRKKYPSDTLEDRIVLRLVMGWTTGIYHYKESLYPGFYHYTSHLQQCPIEL